MIPIWKLKRELRRLKKQLRRAYWHPWGFLQRLRYDMQRGTRVTRHQGRVAPNKSVAIFLIWEPEGVLDSSFLTLEWLVANGVAPIVVSNAKLSEPDLEALKRTSYLVVERPNYGYDFGGYREGVLTLWETGLLPTELFVLNDSNWLPLRRDCDLIEKARAAPEDLYGLHLTGVPNSDREHLQSYFYRFSQTILESAMFRSYWKQMRLIDDKFLVIRLYEKKLSRKFVNAGFSVGALFTWDDVVAKVFATQAPARDSYVQFEATYGQKPAAARVIEYLDDESFDPEKKAELQALVEKNELFVNLTGMHPAFLIDQDVPFLKKNRQIEFQAQRKLIRDQQLYTDCESCVRREILAWDEVTKP